MVKEIYAVLQCYVCKRYVDRKTRQIVPKPQYGMVMSHTYCDDCKAEAMRRIEFTVTESMIERELSKRKSPDYDAMLKTTMDHYDKGR